MLIDATSNGRCAGQFLSVTAKPNPSYHRNRKGSPPEQDILMQAGEPEEAQ